METEEEKEMVDDMGKDTEGTKTGPVEKEEEKQEEHNNEETDCSEMGVSSDEDSDTTINWWDKDDDANDTETEGAITVPSTHKKSAASDIDDDNNNEMDTDEERKLANTIREKDRRTTKRKLQTSITPTEKYSKTEQHQNPPSKTKSIDKDKDCDSIDI